MTPLQFSEQLDHIGWITPCTMNKLAMSAWPLNDFALIFIAHIFAWKRVCDTWKKLRVMNNNNFHYNLPIFCAEAYIAMTHNISKVRFNFYTKSHFHFLSAKIGFFVKETYNIWCKMAPLKYFFKKLDHIGWIMPVSYEFISFLYTIAHLNNIMSISIVHSFVWKMVFDVQGNHTRFLTNNYVRCTKKLLSW
jgi:hypothetical protein